MFSIKDIARIAGVSVATVSRVLNNKEASIPISEETRERVLAVIEKNNYKPNYAARRLRNKELEQSIGIYIPWGWGIGGPASFTAKLLETVSLCIQGSSYYLSLIFYESGSIETHYQELLRVRTHRISGMLIAGADPDDIRFLDAAVRMHRSPPFVVLHRKLSYGNYVTADNRNGAVEMVRHCARLGLRRIAYLSTPKEHQGVEDHVYRERFEGYRAGMEANGIPWDDGLVRFTEEVDDRSMGAVLEDLLARQPAPEALFAARDSIALCLLRARRHLASPAAKNLQIVTFTDSADLCRIVEPPMTSVVLPVEEMGKKATERLLHLIGHAEREETPLQLELPCRLFTAEP